MNIQSSTRIPLHDGLSIRVWRDRTGGAASKVKFPYDDTDIQKTVITHSSDLIDMMLRVRRLTGVTRVELTDKLGRSTQIE